MSAPQPGATRSGVGAGPARAIEVAALGLPVRARPGASAPVQSEMLEVREDFQAEVGGPMNPTIRSSLGMTTVLVALALIAVFGGVVLTCVPLAACPSVRFYQSPASHYDLGRLVERTDPRQTCEINGITYLKYHCPRCRGTSKVTLVDKWLGSDQDPVAERGN